MSRVVIIENGVVTDAIIADLAWVQQHYPNADVREHPQAGPGWILVDEELQAPPTAPEPESGPRYDPDTVALIGYLVTQGLLTQERADEILAQEA